MIMSEIFFYNLNNNGKRINLLNNPKSHRNPLGCLPDKKYRFFMNHISSTEFLTSPKNYVCIQKIYKMYSYYLYVHVYAQI